jgi:hypothetical protein
MINRQRGFQMAKVDNAVRIEGAYRYNHVSNGGFFCNSYIHGNSQFLEVGLTNYGIETNTTLFLNQNTIDSLIEVLVDAKAQRARYGLDDSGSYLVSTPEPDRSKTVYYDKCDTSDSSPSTATNVTTESKAYAKKANPNKEYGIEDENDDLNDLLHTIKQKAESKADHAKEASYGHYDQYAYYGAEPASEPAGKDEPYFRPKDDFHTGKKVAHKSDYKEPATEKEESFKESKSAYKETAIKDESFCANCDQSGPTWQDELADEIVNTLNEAIHASKIFSKFFKK